ncbi:amidase [Patescibacteria group bacterium]|jgi:aspartyl-tRNA(Asn)/glutamyl-tRNA(Gln) amidotransferase subunit A|nr:Asp-tRNA(Asn)/Glu-tRNA(Gln) amidotransferase subunit GatA [Candidatus Dojkabacteria bacterium]CAG1021620.1 amidase [Patescibacteria group bacterium]
MAERLEIPQIDSLVSTVEKVKRGEIKIVDLVTQHLKRAHEVNPQINAFITIFDDAIEKAKELDAKVQADEDLTKYKLLGIPFTAKDLYLVENTRTTFASKFMDNFIAPYTATIVQKCLDQGAILIGKTNCDPWGFGGSGENSGYGPTKNPLDFSKTPGGSSSGSAASLLAGVGFFSLGTDTGGSVRLPASFCGIYALKPTYGRNSRYGIGAMGSSFDTPGFFTRNIEDMALVESIIAGKDTNDASTFEVPVDTYSDYINDSDLSNITIGIPKEFYGEGVETSVTDAINIKIEELKQKGVKFKNVSIPSAKYGLAAYYILVPSEISSNRARYDGVRYGQKVSDNYEENLFEARSRYLETEVKRRIMIGTYSLSAGYSDAFYKQASKVRTKLKREFNEAFKEVDALLTPVSPSTAFKLGEKTNDPVQMYLVDIYSVTANLVGAPAVAVPAGKDDENMPIGLQIMGRNFEEGLLMKIAKEI